MGFRIEIDVMCVILMLWIFHRTNSNKDEKRSQRPMLFLVYSLAGACVLDIFCAVAQGRAGLLWNRINHVLLVFFLILMILTCYMWFIYANTFTRTKKLSNEENCWGYRIPLFALIIMILFSPWAELVYRLPEAINYPERGFLSFISSMIFAFYVIMAAVQLLIAFFNDPETKSVLSFETCIFYIALPPAAMAINFFLKDINTLIPAFSLALAAVCFDIQIGHISTDGLTGLNNKRQYLQFIENCLNEPQGPLQLFLFMIDLDYFKQINDKYGHSEGDKALIEVAELLKGLCSGSRGMFLARYGGDEFVFVIKARFDDEIIRLKRDIENAIKDRNEKTPKKYRLSVSIGYAVYQYGTDTLESLTARADDMLYKEKNDHHFIFDREAEKEETD